MTEGPNWTLLFLKGVAYQKGWKLISLRPFFCKILICNVTSNNSCQ